MTDEELDGLLNDLESDRSERTASFADPEKVRQAICAFANDMPNRLPLCDWVTLRDRQVLVTVRGRR